MSGEAYRKTNQPFRYEMACIRCTPKAANVHSRIVGSSAGFQAGATDTRVCPMNRFLRYCLRPRADCVAFYLWPCMTLDAAVAVTYFAHQHKHIQHFPKAGNAFGLTAKSEPRKGGYHD